METFSYVARAQDGSLTRGTIDAKNGGSARASLLSQYADILDLTALPKDQMVSGPLYQYFPLVETLRLYSGWLFAILFALYAVGAQMVLYWNMRLPLVRQWVEAPLFRDVALASFLFLLATSLHKILRGRTVLALLLLLLSLGALAVFMGAHMA